MPGRWASAGPGGRSCPLRAGTGRAFLFLGMDVSVERLAGPGVAERAVEIVERKGLGHPDTICDALSEQLSLALSRFYLERFGRILHHNVDKALLWGGASRPAFGGGAVDAPMEIFLAGRAVRSFRGVEVPVEEMVVETSRRWLADHLHALDPEKHVVLRCLVRPGSGELADLFLRQERSGVWLANDTSCGVGYAPLSELERVVHAVEAELNAVETKARAPEVGEDVKVMGVRHGDAIHLTVACALVDRFVTDREDYLAKKARVAAAARGAARAHTELEIGVEVNAADDPAGGSLYLTVTGTSAEAGDDGEAGRGNRVNGLITPCRPMTMESVAGKNPVTHVGKLYNLAAGLIAETVVAELPEVREAECRLVSEIGRPVAEPRAVDLGVRGADGNAAPLPVGEVAAIVREGLARIDRLAGELVRGELGIDRWPLHGKAARLTGRRRST